MWANGRYDPDELQSDSYGSWSASHAEAADWQPTPTNSKSWRDENWDSKGFGKGAETPSADNSPPPAAHRGVLKMFNESKGSGFISPVLSKLPLEFSSANGLWFFSAPNLPTKDQLLGKHVEFNIEAGTNGKPQAIDVVLARNTFPSMPAKGKSREAVSPVIGSSPEDRWRQSSYANKAVVVSMLPTSWNIQDLEQHFGQYGSVDTVAMLPDRERTGCIVFSTRQEAEAASSRGTTGCLRVQSFPNLPLGLQTVVAKLFG
jgi:cold shock CspA family protein